MRKTIFVTILVLVVRLGFSNPIIPPPVISEFYYVNDTTWSLELYFNENYFEFFYESTISDFDDFQIITTSGSSSFKSNIPLAYHTVITITPNDLLGSLPINPDADYILLRLSTSGQTYSLDRIDYGYTNSKVGTPFPGQSIVNNYENCFDDISYQFRKRYRLVKTNNPSIGSSPFMASCQGRFTGSVVDMLGQPVPDIRIGIRYQYNWSYSDCNLDFLAFHSDSQGMFDEMRNSGRYNLQLFTETVTLLNVMVDIEPDVDNHYDFQLDTTLTSIQGEMVSLETKLIVYPNPAKSGVFFWVVLPPLAGGSKTLIKIYNKVGVIVKILPVPPASTGEKMLVEWRISENSQKPVDGTYHCVLEVDGIPLKTEQLIIAE